MKTYRKNGMSKYCSNVFEIPAKDNSLTARQDTKVIPLYHRNYHVLNIGRVPIKAEVIFGTALGWHGTAVQPVLVQPGEATILDMTKNLYFLTTVKIYNEQSLRALVHVGRDDASDWDKRPKHPIKLDINMISNNIIKFSPANIPLISDKLDPILDFFFPQKGIIWGTIIDESIQIHTKIKLDIRQLRTKLINLNALLEHKEASVGASFPYQFMQLMEDLLGFEKKFVISKEATNADYHNYISLAYYSSMVSLKMCLYQFGILNRIKIGLNDEQVRRLLLLSKQLIEDRLDGAITYINRVATKAINNEYNNCEPQLAYDSIATVQTYCGLAGLQFIPYWNGILTNPFWKKKAYNNVIIYSTYFGRPSPLLYKQMVQEEVVEPLQPQSIRGVRNKMIGVDVWLWRNNSRSLPKIGGMTVHFQNGNVYNLGTATREAKSFFFDNALLVKLTAWGVGAIDCLEFGFSDGRIITCGSKGSQEEFRDFELGQHCISGLYLASDVPFLNGQAANIAVSFQLISEL